MRTRTSLVGTALAAALLTGGFAATAQAAPAAPSASAPSAASASAASVGSGVDATVQSMVKVGTYRSRAACESDAVNGVYSYWECRKITSTKWELWIDDES
ncbi:hypothetical protein [Streptomyces sp. NPDC050504]|uniref:hypothetical protein n=1 Tax=Streptomyces sp. NPDC050504 TaxID=3365618 RepID=UPI00379FD35A